MGQHNQLDLGVVGGDKKMTRLGVEGAADAAAVLVPDGDILQIGIAAGYTPCGGTGLHKGGMNASGIRVDQLGQGIHIGGFELGQGPMDQDLLGNGIFLGQLCEHRGIRGVAALGLLDGGELPVGEEHLLELFGGVDVELLAAEIVDLLLQGR